MKRIRKRSVAAYVLTILLTLSLAASALAAVKTDYPTDASKMAAWQLPFAQGTTWTVESDAEDHRDRYDTGFSTDFILDAGNDMGVYAPFSGIVVQTTQSVIDENGADGGYTKSQAQRYGNFIQLIDPVSGYSVIMAHLGNGTVPFDQLTPGTYIEQGMYLGAVSNTRSDDEFATVANFNQVSVHLHFEILKNTDVAELTLDSGVKIGPYSVDDLTIGKSVTGEVQSLQQFIENYVVGQTIQGMDFESTSNKTSMHFEIFGVALTDMWNAAHDEADELVGGGYYSVEDGEVYQGAKIFINGGMMCVLVLDHFDPTGQYKKGGEWETSEDLWIESEIRYDCFASEDSAYYEGLLVECALDTVRYLYPNLTALEMEALKLEMTALLEQVIKDKLSHKVNMSFTFGAGEIVVYYHPSRPTAAIAVK